MSNVDLYPSQSLDELIERIRNVVAALHSATDDKRRHELAEHLRELRKMLVERWNDRGIKL